MVYQETIPVSTRQRTHLVDITDRIQDVVAGSGVRNGIAAVCCLHTTAGITINENADPDVGRDVQWKLCQLVPHSDDYHHGEGNSDSHVKSSLVGQSAVVPVCDGRLVFGTWQSVYFCEFDGPRNRRVFITVIGE